MTDAGERTAVRPGARRLAGALRMPRFPLLTVSMVLSLAVVTGLSACTAAARTGDAPGPAKAAVPFVDCDRLAAPASSHPAVGARTELPALSLPCFAGGRTVDLATLHGPAVLNLWASWCGPCRAELPAMQRLADRTTGRLTVVGVDTGDGRDAAASFAADQGISMPTLYDPEQRLMSALGRAALPVTVLLDERGTAYVHALPLSGTTELNRLVEARTGVVVTR
ncbi:TlpA family protein disulfide reductase [Mangrovihabitans endophyticus]|uniref:Thioredoxin domain-containing protein n=1 Tax=Mangrovihabitans endophyticus TaxID=1751298 RepID=A0A8J3C1D9_9ACTN|nr:TlpA disulfide reductase family protein [Mangrovihabitans endophyticus]GGL03509.1 hypothetical protein GCM10012284_42610 [Mangrovihabitans endophyticus]